MRAYFAQFYPRGRHPKSDAGRQVTQNHLFLFSRRRQSSDNGSWQNAYPEEGHKFCHRQRGITEIVGFPGEPTTNSVDGQRLLRPRRNAVGGQRASGHLSACAPNASMSPTLSPVLALPLSWQGARGTQPMKGGEPLPTPFPAFCAASRSSQYTLSLINRMAESVSHAMLRGENREQCMQLREVGDSGSRRWRTRQRCAQGGKRRSNREEHTSGKGGGPNG